MIKQGQNKISRALIWDKVHLCRPNMTGDMIKNVKTVIFKKCQFMPQNYKKMQNLTLFENHSFYIFYHISGHIWPTETYFTSN